MGGAGAMNRANPYGAAPGANLYGAAPNPKAGGNKRVGDWKCYACGNINYANREQCNKCGTPRSNFIAKSGLRAGDWICPACQNHNFADKVVCNKCGTPKGNVEGS